MALAERAAPFSIITISIQAPPNDLPLNVLKWVLEDSFGAVHKCIGDQCSRSAFDSAALRATKKTANKVKCHTGLNGTRMELSMLLWRKEKSIMSQTRQKALGNL